MHLLGAGRMGRTSLIKLPPQPISYHSKSNKQLISLKKMHYKYIKLSLYYETTTENLGTNRKMDVSQSTLGNTIKRKQALHLHYATCSHNQESLSLLHIQFLTEDGIHSSWNPEKSSLHLNMEWTESPISILKRWTGTECRGQGSFPPEVHFQTSKYWAKYTTLHREICAKDLFLIIQHSILSLSVQLHTFMIFIFIKSSGGWEEKHRYLGTECEQKVSKLTFPTKQKSALYFRMNTIWTWFGIFLLFPKVATIDQATSWLTDYQIQMNSSHYCISLEN